MVAGHMGGVETTVEDHMEEEVEEVGHMEEVEVEEGHSEPAWW